jgi:hypothetical protein
VNRKKILVLSDLRDFSDVVAKKALFISNQYKKALDILHIEEKSFLDFFKEKTQVSLDKCKTILVEKYGSEANVFCKCGDFIPTIQEHIEQNDISALIVGFKRDRTFIEDITDGSHLNSIVRKTNIPVLVIKTENEPVYNNILIPTDLSPSSKENIEYLASLFPQAHFYIEHYYKAFFEDRMRLYGFDSDEARRFINHYKVEAEHHLDEFIETLSLPDTIKVFSKAKKYLDINTMVQESIEFNNIDLLSLSTSGNFSIFSFDLLEKSSKDVIIFKIS